MTGIILIGHGGIPSDFPRDLLARLKSLEGQRKATGGPVTAEETALDHRIRTWPRTGKSDPYKFGLEALAQALQAERPADRVVTAYNEFCAPTIQEAAEGLILGGQRELRMATPMMTPGGHHSEVEIPQIVAELVRLHPGVSIRYAWPFDLEDVARFLSKHLERFR